MSAPFHRYLKCERGSSAAEFALVFPLAVVLIFGTIHISAALYATATMHTAVEEAARCAAVRTDTCSDATTTQAYAANFYTGPGASPTFVYATDATCGSPSDSTRPGHRVTGSASYSINFGFLSKTIPIQATACFP